MTDQLKANKVARILSDRQLKYTCLVVKKGGQLYEFQSATIPSVRFNDVTRTPVLTYGQYEQGVICNWDEVDAFFYEENPGATEEK